MPNSRVQNLKYCIFSKDTRTYKCIVQLSWTSFLQLKNRSQFSPIIKWKFIPSYQCSRHCVLAPAFQLLFILPSTCSCFTQIIGLQWLTGSQTHSSPPSILHTPKPNQGYCSISVQAFIFFSQIYTNHRP